MTLGRFRVRGALLLVLVPSLLAVAPLPAQAAPPSNDSIDAAAVIGTVPFQLTQSTIDATLGADDPTSCDIGPSVWFRLTAPRDMVITANTFGSDYNTVLSVFTGSAAALSPVPGGCNDNAVDQQSRVAFAATAGSTYYVGVLGCCSQDSGGTLVLAVDQVPVPANDNFAGATAVSAVPFNDTLEPVAVTTEAGEPSSCAATGGTAWYAFTPAETASFTVSKNFRSDGGALAIFTGASLANLQEVACRGVLFTNDLPFRATAGQTYFVQVGGLTAGMLPLRFTLDRAPAPQPFFGIVPQDPSVFDTVRFFDSTFDPAGGQITATAWDFGDGTTASGNGVSHRYAADGDYPAKLTVTTEDGRSAAFTRVIRVRTHDVAIARISAPRIGRVNRTAEITVRVRNTRLPETVTVDLMKITAAGVETVGSLSQSVPVGPATQTTRIPFHYTFTRDDRRLGPVTFQAVVSLDIGHDAVPADNQATAPPTTVR
jgi:hypothetical protein